MPWKIVNLDYDTDRPHLHMKDPDRAIHLRTYLDATGEVEICLGDADPDACPVRAIVGPNDVRVNATRFQRAHWGILESILTALDVDPDDRADALAWMADAMSGNGTKNWYNGNVESHPRVSTWPRDLTDDALLDAVRERNLSKPRYEALKAEVRRRRLSLGRWGDTAPGPA